MKKIIKFTGYGGYWIINNLHNGKIIIIRKGSKINVFYPISFILIKLINSFDNIKVKHSLIPYIMNIIIKSFKVLASKSI